MGRRCLLKICPKCGKRYLRLKYKKRQVLCSKRCKRALSDIQVRNMRRAYENKWAGIAELSRFYELTQSSIWKILARKNYKDVK